jgi:LmeA-like phospholipid-binding
MPQPPLPAPIVGSVIVVAVVVAVLAALLVADRVGVIYTQDRIAAHVGDWGFSARPHVSVAGFPFLTQLAARRLNKVVISAAGKKLGPVEVKRLDVILYEVRARPGCRNGTASRLSGTALVGFAGLARVAGTPGLTVCADGPDRMKITADLGLVAGTATARVTQAGPGGIRIAVISAGGIPVAALGSLRDITLRLPALPPATTIQSVSVTGQGVQLYLAGHNVGFGRAGRAGHP